MTDEDRIDDLLDEWESAMDAGRDIPVVELCCNAPELQPQVEKKIAQLKRLNGFLGDDTIASVTSNSQDAQPANDICIESQFSLSQFLDQGGLGTVYVGYDKLLRREAAIKFLRLTHAAREECVKQFKTECEITSRLDHPSVVPIYGHGTLKNGQPYYVMRRVSGKTMAQRAEQLHERTQRKSAKIRRTPFSFEYILAIEFLLGVSGQVWNVAVIAGMQLAVPEKMRGRVLGLIFMIAYAGFIGQPIVGQLADVYGDQVALGIFGLIPSLVLAWILLFRMRLLLQMEEYAGNE